MSESLTNTNHFISLAQAVEMTTTYRAQLNTILKDEYQGQNILVRSETFDRAAFDQVLAQAGCAGLRIYYGMDAELKVHAIIVGVNGSNEDMLPAASLSASSASADSAALTAGDTEPTPTDDGELIIEAGTRCPDDCPPPSPLNP